jgi:hypothetical protein
MTVAKVQDLRIANITAPAGIAPSKDRNQDVKLRQITPGDLRADAGKRRDDERKSK